MARSIASGIHIRARPYRSIPGHRAIWPACHDKLEFSHLPTCAGSELMTEAACGPLASGVVAARAGSRWQRTCAPV